MSGKSYFITQLARNWENNITLEPLSQIWLVAQSISDGMRQRLTETAKELGIPLFCCPGGLSHPFFRASWSRCLKTNNLLLPDEEGRHKIESLSNNNQTNNNHKENNMTDQKNEEEEEKEKEKEEEEEEEEEKEEEEEEEEEETNEECKQFLKSFLSKPRKNANYFQSIQKPLSSRPRINSSAKKFLSLRDGDLPTKSFIHTSKSIPSKTDREKYSSFIIGGATTRSMTATKKENPNLPTSSAPDKQPILAQVTTRTRNRKRKKEETDDEDEKKKEEIKRKKEIKDDEEIEKENDDGNKAENAKEQPSFKAQFEKRKLDLENKQSAPILSRALFIFDDCFSVPNSLNENDTNKEYKQITKEYLRRLNFIKDFLIHKRYFLVT